MRVKSFRLPVIAVVGAAVAAALALSACTAGSPSQTAASATPGNPTAAATAGASSPAAPSSSKASTSASAKPGKPVTVSTYENDGSTWGVGMAIIANFADNAPGTSRYFTKAVKVTVNGQDPGGAWFFQASNLGPDPSQYKMQAVYRPQHFWPAHATINVNMPLKGVNAGTGLTFANNLTLTMHTGAAVIGTVSNSHLLVTKDGQQIDNFPLALGANSSPTLLGTKVIIDKHHDERMIGSGYNEIVPNSMRLTYSGEYLHAANWNIGNIDSGTPSSNGCSNMLPADAATLFDQVEPGDPIVYGPGSVPNNTTGKTMPSWDGYGWWNINWSTFSAGGLLINHGS